MAEHPAVQAATPAMVGLLRGLGYPAVLAEARGPRVARLAAPEVLRWAAEHLDAQPLVCAAHAQPLCDQGCPVGSDILRQAAAEVERDTRTEEVGRGR